MRWWCSYIALSLGGDASQRDLVCAVDIFVNPSFLYGSEFSNIGSMVSLSLSTYASFEEQNTWPERPAKRPRLRRLVCWRTTRRGLA
jgi:hypothetical protein